MIRFRGWSHTGVMDYDEACIMHLAPGVVHNFPNAVGVKKKEKGATPGILASRLNNRW